MPGEKRFPDGRSKRRRKPSVVRFSEVTKVYKSYLGPASLLKEILLGSSSHNQFTALEAVSFEVPEGGTLGIVGNNGAGKTTLLRIVIGTSTPTSGRVEVAGRVASVLELGLGFDPQFTGRRNLYFGGSLLGLSREEIASREAKIIEFSGLGEYVDQPMRTYSAGMFLRLAFSLATGVEPDVLVIDEVLAVGDGAFQKKCTERIRRFQERGCTILLCSHALHQVEELCQRALWLHRGRVQAIAPSGQVVNRYLEFSRLESEGQASGSRLDKSAEQGRICWIERAKRSPEHDLLHTGQDLALDIWARFLPTFPGTPAIGVALVREDRVIVYVTSNVFDDWALQQEGPDLYRARLVFPDLPLLSGRYYFNLVTTDEHGLQSYHVSEKMEPFSVVGGEEEPGLTRLAHHWESR